MDISLLWTILVGTVNLVFMVNAILTIEKLGRKPYIIVGELIMALVMFVIGIAFSLENMGILTLVFILISITGFAMSWVPVLWIALSEIYPNSILVVMLIAIAAVWITNLIVP